MKRYAFYDLRCKTPFYARYYLPNGNLDTVDCKPFYTCFILDSALAEMQEHKVGSTIQYTVFYPNPPDCDVQLFFYEDDGSKQYLFEQSNYLNCLKTIYQTLSKRGIYKINIGLKIKEANKKDSAIFNSTVYINSN